MSDLAPFVAATLRDKAMADLLEEVKVLREQKYRLESFEITGPNREPVYARGHFRDDKSVQKTDTSYWTLALKQVQPCPLGEVCFLDVWVGNCCLGRTSDVAHDSRTKFRFLDEPYDNETRTVVLAKYDGDVSLVFHWYVLIKMGWTQDMASSNVIKNNINIHDMSSSDFLQLVTEELPRVNPTSTVQFSHAVLNRDCFSGLGRYQKVVTTSSKRVVQKRKYHECL